MQRREPPVVAPLAVGSRTVATAAPTTMPTTMPTEDESDDGGALGGRGGTGGGEKGGGGEGILDAQNACGASSSYATEDML